MAKKFFYLFAILIFIFSAVFSPAFANATTIFGPIQYNRTTGAPDNYTDTFSAVPGQGRIIIKNGAQTGENRIIDSISSAVIILNGVQIFGPGDFNQQVYLLEADVDLSEDNSLSVELASSPGSYITIEVSQEGAQTPTVTINADPSSIQVGDSTILTWSSTNADSCIIEPGIGTVDPSGSITVSPTETTTYTITATGPGGTATDNATVNVTYPTPTVTISADPETITMGESSALTWTSSYASYVSIDNGIGDVDPNGSIMASPTETTTYTITASNPVESVTASVTITVIPLGITITFPLNNDLISRPDVMVEGIITNPLGLEVGVNVNGVVALVCGNQFVANHVPLDEGINIITATAVDTEGNTSSDTINVYADISGDYIRLDSSLESGVSPLEATLNIEGSFNVSDAEITYTGPGEVVIVEDPEEKEYTASIATEGLYFITAEAVHEGSIYADTVAILVLNESELDALLKAKWSGMKNALIDGDITGSINYIAQHKKVMYEYNLTLMISHLSEISAGLQDIQLVRIKDGMAEYEMWAEQDGQTYSFYILFVKDMDGIWRIVFF